MLEWPLIDFLIMNAVHVSCTSQWSRLHCKTFYEHTVWINEMYAYVVASEPTCSVNISLPGNAVHESDFVKINCTTRYSGSWVPVTNCIPEVSGQLVEETSSYYQVSYIVVMAAADIGDLAMISCETRFALSKSGRPTSNLIERVLDTPQYHHTWHTLPIRVFNTTGNRPNTRFAGRSIKVL